MPTFRATLAFTVVRKRLPRTGGPNWLRAAAPAKALFCPTAKSESSHFNRAHPTVFAFFAQKYPFRWDVDGHTFTEARKASVFGDFRISNEVVKVYI